MRVRACFFVVANVGVPEQNVIVILGLDGFLKPGFVVAVKHGYLSSG